MLDVLPNNHMYTIGNTISFAIVPKTIEISSELVKMYYQMPYIKRLVIHFNFYKVNMYYQTI